VIELNITCPFTLLGGKIVFMETNVLAPDNLAIQEARERFEKYRATHPHITLGFEELLTFFQEESFYFSEIARVLGVPVITVSRMYRSFFQELLLKKSGYDRRRIAKNKEAEAKFSPDEYFTTIAKSARDAGCQVELYIKRSPSRGVWVTSRRIIVNGRHCAIYHACKDLSPKKKSVRVKVPLHRDIVLSVDAVVVYVGVPGFPVSVLVMPCEFLRTMYFSGNARKRYPAFFPLEKKHKRRTPYVDFWQYKDAWHLLPPLAAST